MTTSDVVLLGLGLAVDLVLALLPLVSWHAWGRDPQFTDDASVLMPGPPPDFTPALATLVLDGAPSKRTISAGLMFLVSQDLIRFEAEPSPVGHRVELLLSAHRPRRLHLPGPEADLYQAIRSKVDRHGHLASMFMVALSGAFEDFTRALNHTAVERGWLRADPSTIIRRWRGLAGLEVIAGVALLGWISRLVEPAGQGRALGVAIVGVGAVGAGALTYLVSRWMPARTREGAMLAAMLRAYGRSLKASLAQAHSIEDVVVMAPLPWVGTPGEEIAWGVALDQARAVEGLLAHSLQFGDVGGWPKGIRDWFEIV